MIVAPSILAADFGDLRKDIRRLNKQDVWIHCDIMDGCYNPNLSFGFPVLESIASVANKPLDIHLMTIEPEKYIDRLLALQGVMLITVHYEAFVTHGVFNADAFRSCISKIRSCRHVNVGLAIEPGTSIASVQHVFADIDVLLIMSVQSGYGGQKFIESTYDKIKEAKAYLQSSVHKFTIEVDGGVNLDNCGKLAACGADMIVAGTAIFKAKDMQSTIKQLSCIY